MCAVIQALIAGAQQTVRAHQQCMAEQREHKIRLDKSDLHPQKSTSVTLVLGHAAMQKHKLIGTSQRALLCHATQTAYRFLESLRDLTKVMDQLTMN